MGRPLTIPKIATQVFPTQASQEQSRVLPEYVRDANSSLSRSCIRTYLYGNYKPEYYEEPAPIFSPADLVGPDAGRRTAWFVCPGCAPCPRHDSGHR